MWRRRVLAGVALAATVAGTQANAGEPERQVLAELNLARTEPQTYAARLREYRRWYTGRILAIPGNPTQIVTDEGVPAVDEAIRFLDRQPALPPLQSDAVLALAAQDWVSEQGRRGTFGHRGADGRGPKDRVFARGGGRNVAENIAYGAYDPVFVVAQLIVDDGVADRGHRNIIYDSSLAYAGAACGPHVQYSRMCVIDYSTYPKGVRQSPPMRSAAAALRVQPRAWKSQASSYARTASR